MNAIQYDEFWAKNKCKGIYKAQETRNLSQDARGVSHHWSGW